MLWFELFTLSILSLWAPVYYRQRLGWLITIFWAYLIMNCLVVSHPVLFTPIYNMTNEPQIRASALKYLLIIVMAPILMMNINERKFLKSMSAFLCADSLLLLTNHPGLFTGTSVDSTLIALGLSFNFMWRWGKILTAINTLAILWVGGATGIIILFLQALRILTKKYAIWLIPIAALFSGIAYGMYGIKPFVSAARLELWHTHMAWWIDLGWYWFGTGGGSYEWIGPYLEVRNQRFVWMHNEFLQVFFEFGFVGLSLMCLAAGAVFKGSLESKEKLVAFLSLLVAYSFQSIMHTPVGILIALFYIKKTLRL